jgi:hypothetical protein
MTRSGIAKENGEGRKEKDDGLLGRCAPRNDRQAGLAMLHSLTLAAARQNKKGARDERAPNFIER